MRYVHRRQVCADIATDVQYGQLDGARRTGVRDSAAPRAAIRGAAGARAVCARENDSAFGFGARLFAAVALTFALIGVVGYVLVDRNLEHRQIQNYAAAQRADARGFEDVAAHAASPADAIAQVDRLLDAIARRPGTLEAVLIDQRHVDRGGGRESR